MKPSDKLMIMLMGSKKPKEESEKKENTSAEGRKPKSVGKTIADLR